MIHLDSDKIIYKQDQLLIIEPRIFRDLVELHSIVARLEMQPLLGPVCSVFIVVNDVSIMPNHLKL